MEINKEKIISVLSPGSEGFGKIQVKTLNETERRTLVAMLQALQKGDAWVKVEENVLESLEAKLKNRDISGYEGSNFLEKLVKFLGSFFSLRTSSKEIWHEIGKTFAVAQKLHKEFDTIKNELLAIDEKIKDYKEENNIEFHEDMDVFYKNLQNILGSVSLNDLKSVVKEKFEELEGMRSTIIDAKLGSILEKNLLALGTMLNGDKLFMEISIRSEIRNCAFVLNEEKEWLAKEFPNLDQLRERKVELLSDPRVIKSMENEISRIDEELANLPSEENLKVKDQKFLRGVYQEMHDFYDALPENSEDAKPILERKIEEIRGKIHDLNPDDKNRTDKKWVLENEILLGLNNLLDSDHLYVKPKIKYFADSLETQKVFKESFERRERLEARKTELISNLVVSNLQRELNEINQDIADYEQDGIIVKPPGELRARRDELKLEIEKLTRKVF